MESNEKCKKTLILEIQMKSKKTSGSIEYGWNQQIFCDSFKRCKSKNDTLII